MKVAIAGGTGFIGRALARTLVDRRHSVIFLSRRAQRISPEFPILVWDPSHPGGLEKILSGCDAFVNLAGESIDKGRWTPERRAALQESRLSATRGIVELIKRCPKKPPVLVNASAIGYYGNRGDEKLTENSSPGTGFLPDLCQAWEKAAGEAEPLGVRVVRLRIGLVLGRGGGALAKMLLPFKLCLGARLGEGDQWWSWIHIKDLVDMILVAIEKPAWNGAYNATSPHPLTNREFSKTLAFELGRPCFLKAPPFALRALVGPMADEVLLAGQKVFPEKAQKLKFGFHYPRLDGALRSLLKG